jgi:cell division septum initiation protein DivIVA
MNNNNIERPDPKLDRFLNNIAGKISMNEDSLINESEYRPKNNAVNSEIEELKQQIAYLTEIVENLSQKIVITEGSADTVDIIIGGHHFRGKMSPVKR